jgi:hypothetical protein
VRINLRIDQIESHAGAILLAIPLALSFSTSTALAAQDNDALKAKIKETRALILKTRAADDYRASIRKSVLAYESTLDSHCKDVVLDFDSAKDMILTAVERDVEGGAIAGTWRETIPGTACNEKRMYNVDVNETPQGLRFTPTFPGDAAGDPELQSDTLNNIERNFRILGISKKKSCRVQVLDTHLVGAASQPLPSGLQSPWRESWDVRTCGIQYAVPITFTPDADGTTITVHTTDIKRL